MTKGQTQKTKVSVTATLVTHVKMCSHWWFCFVYYDLLFDEYN